MKLISYFQNRPIPIKVKPCFTDTRLVRKAYYCRQFALSLGKESHNLSLLIQPAQYRQLVNIMAHLVPLLRFDASHFHEYQ